jgi:hypothetical protein
LEILVKHLNELVPKQVDPITTLVGVELREPATIVYFYELETSAGRIDTSILQETIHDRVCAEKTMRAAIGAGATFLYNYRDIVGTPVLQVNIEECASGHTSN